MNEDPASWALIAQWIERRPPEPETEVQLLLRAPRGGTEPKIEVSASMMNFGGSPEALNFQSGEGQSLPAAPIVRFSKRSVDPADWRGCQGTIVI